MNRILTIVIFESGEKIFWFGKYSVYKQVPVADGKEIIILRYE